MKRGRAIPGMRPSHPRDEPGGCPGGSGRGYTRARARCSRTHYGGTTEASRPRDSGRAKRGRRHPSEASHRPKGGDHGTTAAPTRPSEARPQTSERSEPPTRPGKAGDRRGATKLPPQYLAGVAGAVHHGSAVLRALGIGMSHQQRDPSQG